jgi:probable rRNA maturation factor
MIHIRTEIDLPPEINHKMLHEAILMTLSDHNKSDSDITLRLTNDEEIHQLNFKFRKQDKATDVLSFNYNFDDPETKHHYLGDIVISMETAAIQAPKYHLSLNQELVFLAIHGTLHLLGYNHEQPDQKETMWRLQDVIFDKVKSSFKED